MPRSYSNEAVEGCLRLYLRFNGQQHDRIENEMRKTWPGWSKQNLYTRGKEGSQQKIGWIEKYGWEAALKQKLENASKTTALTSAEQLVREIEEVRKRIKQKIDALGAGADRDLIYQHRDYCKLSIDALTKVEAARDTLGGFVSFWERLLDWLPLISEKAARELLRVADEVIEKAAAEYGETEPNVGHSSSQV